MEKQPVIWSVAGGAGGRGKTLASVNLACLLAGRGWKVVLVEADPGGGSRAGQLFGVDSGRADLEKDDLSEAAVDTGVEGVRVIPGAGSILAGGEAGSPAWDGFVTRLAGCEADFIVADFGSSVSGGVYDFIALSDGFLAVLEPAPEKVQGAFGFLRGFVYRRMERVFSDNPLVGRIINDATDPGGAGAVKTFSDLCERLSTRSRRAAEKALFEVKGFHPALLLNLVSSDEDERAADVLSNACGVYLGLDAVAAGALSRSDAVVWSVAGKRPFALSGAGAGPAEELDEALEALLEGGETRPDEPPPGPPEEAVPEEAEVEEAFGFNDNVRHRGMTFHVQTEVSGGGDPMVETVVYQGGRVYFSKRARWSEVGDPSGMVDNIHNYASRQHKAAMAAVRSNRITAEGGA